ncbi:terminase small subunit [Bergeriella denitrificans]|uniref:Uncharacterized protein n=1 Tax=Bergeriella denitrificans TaxID=494 RepID=A0A378UJ92_BERDE|nr:terminase small subunit [Bergeriella denitrificans]STZ77355.1 Uncharacterised protein [Bergeriella denitrificans]
MSDKKRPVGRPLGSSKLTDEVIECAWAYLKGGYKEQGNAVPSIAGLAFALGRSRECVYEWARKNENFSDILKAINTAQEMLLIDNTLTGEFNAPFAKLLMTKHGYTDKVDNTSSDGSLSPTVIKLVVPDE